MMSKIPAPGRASTATHPAGPGRDRDRTQLLVGSHSALSAASAAMTTSTITERNNLSAVPNVWIAHSLTGPGVRLMTAVPTADAHIGGGRENRASNWATPTATAAAAPRTHALAGR